MFNKILPASPNTGWDCEIRASGEFTFEILETITTDHLAVRSVATVNDGNLHFIGVSYDGSKNPSGIIMYLDGLPTPKTIVFDTLSGVALNDEILRFGHIGGGGLFFLGQAGKFILYNKVVSPNEVKQMYINSLIMFERRG